MEFITSTQIRSQFPKAIATLRLGKSIRVIHRSKVIGNLTPEDEPKVFTQKDADAIKANMRRMNLPILTDAEIEKRYRAAMMKKHGQHLS